MIAVYSGRGKLPVCTVGKMVEQIRLVIEFTLHSYDFLFVHFVRGTRALKLAASTGRREDSLLAELPAAASRSMRLAYSPHAVPSTDIHRDLPNLRAHDCGSGSIY